MIAPRPPDETQNHVIVQPNLPADVVMRFVLCLCTISVNLRTPIRWAWGGLPLLKARMFYSRGAYWDLLPADSGLLLWPIREEARAYPDFVLEPEVRKTNSFDWLKVRFAADGLVNLQTSASSIPPLNYSEEYSQEKVTFDQRKNSNHSMEREKEDIHLH